MAARLLLEKSPDSARERFLRWIYQSILVRWWTGFAAYACHWAYSIANGAGFFLRFALIRFVDSVWIRIDVATNQKSSKESDWLT
jgi:hypothetical protein